MKETRCVIFEGLYAVTAGADTLPLLVDSEIRPDGSNLKTAINCKVESCRRWNDFRERERERERGFAAIGFVVKHCHSAEEEQAELLLSPLSSEVHR